jgi:hypothetical protein
MNSGWRIAALLLLSGMAGCNHKVQSGPPAAAQAPIYPPNTVAKDEPLPQPPQPKPLDVQPAPAEVAEQPPPKTKKPAHHKKPADTTQTQAAKDTAGAAPGTQQASTGQPPDDSPIGQLSSDSTGTPTRRQIQDQIKNTEDGLNGIKRALTSDEQQTATQIRTFLTKARKALDQDDLDGANTLVTKAKVLLDELTKG